MIIILSLYVYLQPKTRPATVFPSRYASLPSSNNQKPSLENDQQQQQSNGNGVYIGRDFIGIKINDVHNAVLKSGARMPGKLNFFFSYLNFIKCNLMWCSFRKIVDKK